MGHVFVQLQEPLRRRRPGEGLALWDLGFRPFYLLAASLALLSVPLWALQFSGLLSKGGLRGAAWHAHEMVFGYALAIVIGFLFTAGRNWSGQATPTGRPLMALAALWVLARVLVLTPWLEASLLVNVAVPWAAAWGLWRALSAGGNRRNYFFVGLLLAMGAASAVLHLTHLGWLGLPVSLAQGLGLMLGLDVLLFMIAVMAGRVLPMFSNNGVPGMNARRDPRVERAALGSVLLLLAFDALGLSGPLLLLALLPALLAHVWRFALWQPWKTLGNPLVWVLHAAYAWLLLHLGLRSAAALDWLPASAATHALTIGLIGLMTLGMITRTALGHTGRPLKAGPVETLAYLAMLGAALVRVFVPLLMPAALLPAVWLSAALWALAFVLYLWRYGPMLLRPRVDGLPG
ncbi:NnrS family protein [Paucibacter sp. TC2R-5]|uniref:NnrS family protein n=1 Tax=Paucibacter sp. TC2R-5 TaxID=2893555 RepID=UPI0021E3D8B0|nr:NnrS family protein [Paucibacter sp. TC2R-5]MCV2358867.1 NnrS family protein [Paucibacter sp. TC2R-5]